MRAQQHRQADAGDDLDLAGLGHAPLLQLDGVPPITSVITSTPAPSSRRASAACARRLTSAGSWSATHVDRLDALRAAAEHVRAALRNACQRRMGQKNANHGSKVGMRAVTTQR